MVATAIKQKATRLFEAMDEDGDGRITAADFEQTAARLIKGCGNDDTSAVNRLRTAYRNAWEDLARQADADGDGQVTREEFEEAFAGARSLNLLGTVREALHAEFDLADKDRNGTLDSGELRTMLKAFGVPESELTESVDVIDRDGDGVVSREEYVSAMEQFYISEDTSALFGGIRG